MRKTHAAVQVAQALMEDPLGRHWGYELSKRSHVRSGVMYPILQRFYEQEWLADGWEEQTGRRRRPPRRYYQLTDTGRRELGALLDQARNDLRFAALFELGTT